MLQDYVYAKNYKGNASLGSQLNLTEQDEYPLAKRRKLTTPKAIVSDTDNLDDFAAPLDRSRERSNVFWINQDTETIPSYYKHL